MAFLAIVGEDGLVERVIVIPSALQDPVAYGESIGLTGILLPFEELTVAIGMIHLDGKLLHLWRQVWGDGEEMIEDLSGYPIDTECWHNGKGWVSLIGTNIWEPGISGWRELGAAPDWIEPANAHDVYPLDALVTYQGATWMSTAAANVWAPGVYGWVQQ